MTRDTHGAKWLFARVCLLVSIAASGATARAESFGYRRGLTAETGWVRLTLPNDVLQECRPDLADLRILAGTTEVPYALEDALVPAAQVIDLRNVESRVGQETTALLDRGEHPAACDALELSISSSTVFLKPLVVESSEDGVTFSRIAQGSVFRTAAASNLSIGFAANDRRYLRIHLDDRSSAPVQPISVAVHLARVDVPLQSYRLVPAPTAGSDLSFDSYTLELPTANLDLTSLDIETRERAFARRVRVYELVLFRDELSRRLVGEGSLSRSPSTDQVASLQLKSKVGRRLEVEIERLTNRLAVQQFIAWVRPRVLLFDAPAETLELAYGSSTISAPQYDVGRALNSGQPRTWGTATLAPTARGQPSAASSGQPRRGQHLDVTAWERRQPMILPNHGTLAYVDVPGAAASHLASLRIVTQDGAQVPYLVESDLRHTSFGLQYRISQQGSHTKVAVTGFDPESWLEAVALTAAGPEYFARNVEVTEADPETRGRKLRRQLGRAAWNRAPGEPATELWIPIEKPRTAEFELDIDNGDDTALAIASVLGRVAIKRIDFEFSPNERLNLYWRNPQASPPRYDLTLIANRIFSSPALPASLGGVELTHPRAAVIPKWFWAVAIAAGLIVTLLLARAVTSSPVPKER